VDIGITLYGQFKECKESHCHGKQEEKIDQDALSDHVMKERFHCLLLRLDPESLAWFDFRRPNTGCVLASIAQKNDPDLITVLTGEPEFLVALRHG
jgi:hypothetical protein